jgi:methionine-rich copper-binding protein CopC
MIGWIAALFFLLTPAPLSAHAYLVKSVPAQRAVLLRAPAKIQL